MLYFSEEDYLEALHPTLPATPGEAAAEYARNAGEDNPQRPWILSPYDTWHRNPCYQGPPVPHPEYDD